MTSPVEVDELLSRYRLLLIDAYGVLVTSTGPVAGARELLRRIGESDAEFLVVTNDASRLPETCRSHYAEMGLEIPTEKILTSGMLLEEHFAEHELRGARCVVLGTEDSKTYVRCAGGEIVAADAEGEAEVYVIGDQSGFAFLETADVVLTMLYRQQERGHRPHLVLPNPDLVYPRGGGEFGFASGALAQLLEQALELRFPGAELRFARLGKPHPALYESARRRGGEVEKAAMVMLGDQLVTDIRGANDYGIDSVLVGSGLTDVGADASGWEVRPTYVLPSLAG